MGLLQNIKDGWLNYIKSSISKKSIPAEMQKEIEKRAEICSACPELRLISKNPSSPARGRCGKCGCIFPALIYAPRKSCPIRKWDKIEP